MNKNILTVSPIMETIIEVDYSFRDPFSDGWDKVHEGLLEGLLEDVSTKHIPQHAPKHTGRAERRRAEHVISARRLDKAREMGFIVEDERDLAKIAKGTNAKVRQELHDFSQYGRNGYLGKGQMKGFRKGSHVSFLDSWEDSENESEEIVSSFDTTGLWALCDRRIHLKDILGELYARSKDLNTVLEFWSGFTPKTKIVSSQKEQELRVLRMNIEGIMKDISTYNTELVEVEKEIQNILRWFVR